jgi:hypothetical protein
MVPLLGLALSALPSIVKLFDSDEESTANKAVGLVSSIAQQVTGTEDDDSAATMLKDNPEAFLEFQHLLAKQASDLFAEETRRLEAVNQTMRKEYESADPYVRRWRPTFGYAVAFSWVLMMGAITAVIVMTPAAAASVITAIAGLFPMWGIALAVLGVSVHSRSKDKNPQTSGKGFGVVSQMVNKVLGKDK